MKGEVADRFRPFMPWRVLIVVVAKEAFGMPHVIFLVSHLSRSQFDLFQNRLPSVQYKGGSKIHALRYFFTRTSSIVGGGFRGCDSCLAVVCCLCPGFHIWMSQW
jgi:hypothetical protein